MAGKISALVFISVFLLQFIVFPSCSAEDDPSTWPGHLEPLGARSEQISLESLQSFPEPVEFFQKYASKRVPVLIKGGAKISPAFDKWTDEYLMSIPEGREHKIFTEHGKKENRKNAGSDIPFAEFVSKYRKDDIYMVNGVPPFLQKDVLLPPSLVCEEVTKNDLVDTVMWFSSGGTKSVLHNDDVDNINCLFSGTKELLFIDYKYKDKVKIDHAVGGYSGVDVDRVDFTKYPGLAQVQYYNVTMETGDCLFIPYKWYHQVRSHDRNIAINVWFKHKPGYVPQKCKMSSEGPYTLDKFYFSALTQQGDTDAEGPENLLEHFSSFLVPGDKGKVDYETFRGRMKQDPVMMAGGKYTWNDQFEQVAMDIFKTIDLDKDGLFSNKDADALEDNAEEVTKSLENLAAEIEDLIEDQNAGLSGEKKEGGGEKESDADVFKDEL